MMGHKNWTARALLMGIFAAGLAGWAYQQYQLKEAATVAARANAGQVLFSAMCETCHGLGGNGAGGAPSLQNGQVMAQYPTQAALARFIQTHMPASDPGILTNQQAVDLALWIQTLNRVLPTS